MKALICESPGHLVYQESPAPIPGKGMAILKIKRIGVCGTDLHAYEGTQPFFSYPIILGHEVAGELVEFDGTSDFKKGALVTFIPYFNCDACIACRSGKPNCCEKLKVCGVHINGAMAEYLSVPAYSLVGGNGLNPDSLALVEPLAIGAHAVRRANVQAGEYVAVIGAGPIGLGIMEFARIAGAKVIALDINQTRLDFCAEKLKVPHRINVTEENVEQTLREITKGDMPAVVIDATGNLKAINSAFEYMAHGGRYILVGLQKGDITFSHPAFHKREGTLMSSRNATREDFQVVIEALQNGWLQPSTYITHRVKFDQVKKEFGGWLDPANKVIKAMIAME
jgi:2-desacetyl-2-hydroxyethyl bacteriochlorophyllide A dehydrogenase